MPRLTEKSDWSYAGYKPPPAAELEQLSKEQGSWFELVRSYIPPGARLLELGCAPGFCSAAICSGLDVDPSGVDFSATAAVYLRTMANAGITAQLFRGDVFDFRSDQPYGVVCSFGLVEHFRGEEFIALLKKHDELLSPGGTLIIEVPNFKGFNRTWHSIFDRPSYKKHSLEAMGPDGYRYFIERGYSIEFADYFGDFSLWNESGLAAAPNRVGALIRRCEALLNRAAKWLAGRGVRLAGPWFSPMYIFIARKPASSA